ncbi:hypothetical protein G9A89_015988 [Geosiphon pyriformis]|nr:hypothetical protein G9A89_015988 [Geosiphon pyriformis]
MPDLWSQQYMPLDYINDDAFFGIMNEIGMKKLSLVVDNLPNNKAAKLLLNLCLSQSAVFDLWKKAWVSMILKSYEWNGVLTNTRHITLVNIAHKILSKILSDQILLACSKFNVLHSDNFSVLKGTSIQFSIFAIGSIVEDALEKNKELWLVLQNMCKAYDLVGCLYHIKMCECFIQFFGNIHENWINRVMTNFGFSEDYKVHDRLDQEEVFFLLLWRIFYDPLLCERINSRFMAKSGRIETNRRKTFFLAAGAFVNNTIWIGNSHVSTQYILNIVSEFFVINNISINIDKTVAIPINQGIRNSLSKPSLAQAYMNVKFFSNVMLKKVIMNKQFCYLVSTVLQSIVSYCTQFSFISSAVCHKWDIMIRKSFKAKAGLPHNFSSKVLHYSFLYSLKPFEQVQSEGKLTLLISFSNSCNILGHLFDYRFLNLQVLRWSPLDPLQFSDRLHVSPINNFLAGVVKIFLENKLLLTNNLPCVFCGFGNFLMSSILSQFLYFKSVLSLKQFGVVFEREGNGLKDILLLEVVGSKRPTTSANKRDTLSVLDSDRFFDVCDSLLEIYTDEFLRYAGSAEVIGGTAAYFPTADADIGIRVDGLLSSTLIELQAVVLALECVLSLCSVVLYSDSQSVIDAYTSKTSFTMPDFHNQYNLFKSKNISIKWVKVKRHSGIVGNVKADILANKMTFSSLFLLVGIQKKFLVAEETVVSGNAHYFKIDWGTTAAVWHPNSHMLSEFTSKKLANLCTYLMKTVYKWLPITVRKNLYKKSYPGVLCLMCGEMKLSDHVFTCSGNFGLCKDILVKATKKWLSMSGLSSLSASAILLLFLSCSLDVSLYMAVCKGFVIGNWYAEAVLVFERKKEAVPVLVKFIRFVVELYHDKIWAIRAKHRVNMEKTGLIGNNGLISGLSGSVVSRLSAGVVHMLSVIEFFAVRFGRRKLCQFFSGLDNGAFVSIST